MRLTRSPYADRKLDVAVTSDKLNVVLVASKQRLSMNAFTHHSRMAPAWRLLSLSIAAVIVVFATGCGAPPPVGVNTMDALTGFPVTGVQVERSGKEDTTIVGKTDASGRLLAIHVHLGDRLSFSHAGYQSRIVQIGLFNAQPMKFIPGSKNEDHPQGLYAADPEDETLNYAADRTIIVLMHPETKP